MSAPSNPLTMNPKDFAMIISIRDDDHFQNANDFICFHRSKVKDYHWHHSVNGTSYLGIEFYNAVDALLFKLANG
jgi:hypothetical protein